jgi:hypothetical protein
LFYDKLVGVKMSVDLIVQVHQDIVIRHATKSHPVNKLVLGELLI